MLYHLIINKQETAERKTVNHILSRVPITLDMMATINAYHEDEMWNYEYEVFDRSEAALLSWHAAEFRPEDDFIIFATHKVKLNRMNNAPAWVIRRPQDDYWNDYIEVIGIGKWEGDLHGSKN